MKKAIERAIEGGYKYIGRKIFHNEITDEWYFPNDYGWEISVNDLFLDPLFWQALEKVEGWVDLWDYENRRGGYQAVWHNFITHLAEDKPIDDFFNELLK